MSHLNLACKKISLACSDSLFFIIRKVTLCSLCYQFFMKVTMSGKISLAEAMTKHRKMMMNKCPEQTLQVEIQCYL